MPGFLSGFFYPGYRCGGFKKFMEKNVHYLGNLILLKLWHALVRYVVMTFCNQLDEVLRVPELT